MNELQIISLENTDITNWDFPMLKAELQRRLDTYAGIVYTDDTIRDAKADRTTLNKVKKAIEDARKAYKAKCLAPYEEMEPKIKELTELLESHRLLIDETVKDYENRQKEAKELEVRKYYNRKSAPLGDLADALYPKLFDKKWVNASTGKAKYEESILIAIDGAVRDIEAIKALGSPFMDTLLRIYVETLSLDSVKAKNDELTASVISAGLTAQAVPPTVIAENKPAVEKTNPEKGTSIKVYATEFQLNQLCDFMKAIGVEYELM